MNGHEKRIGIEVGVGAADDVVDVHHVDLIHQFGHRQEAAKLLGWGRNTLTRKIRDLGLE